jgi:hypothetical protein
MGAFLSDWIMSKKHETIMSPNLFYAFVNISNGKLKCRSDLSLDFAGQAVAFGQH